MTSFIGFRIMPCVPSEGKPMAMIRLLMSGNSKAEHTSVVHSQLKSRLKPSASYLRFFFDTKVRIKAIVLLSATLFPLVWGAGY